MGLIFLYTGEGAGKTTNAIGLAVRCVGHGYRAVIIQFMKGRKDIGEYLIKDRLQPEYEIYQFGRKEFLDLKNPSEEDKRRAKEGLEFAQKILREKPRLLVLDEINLAVAAGLLGEDEVLQLLNEIPEETDVVLTGRYASSGLINRADVVNIIVEAKRPSKMYGREGITY